VEDQGALLWWRVALLTRLLNDRRRILIPTATIYTGIPAAGKVQRSSEESATGSAVRHWRSFRDESWGGAYRELGGADGGFLDGRQWCDALFLRHVRDVHD